MRLPEIVGTERRVSEVVRQRIPGHRTGDGERPTAERATTMSWYDEMVAARRSKSLTTASSIEPVARSLRRKSYEPRLLQFLFSNLLVNRLVLYFFDSRKFLIIILSSFVIILSHKCRQ